MKTFVSVLAVFLFVGMSAKSPCACEVIGEDVAADRQEDADGCCAGHEDDHHDITGRGCPSCVAHAGDCDSDSGCCARMTTDVASARDDHRVIQHPLCARRFKSTGDTPGERHLLSKPREPIARRVPASDVMLC